MKENLMKTKFRTAIVSLLLALVLSVTVSAFVGCGEKSPSDMSRGGSGISGNDGIPESFVMQTEHAEKTANEIYSDGVGRGGLFLDKNTVTASAAVSSYVTQSQLREFIDGLEPNITEGAFRTTFHSYVCDIFIYSQVQLALLENFGTDSLVNAYEIEYSNDDWDEFSAGKIDVEWFKAILPYYATFTGADMETGRVYCVQEHLTSYNRARTYTELEYYYNSPDDYGVVTLNLQYGTDGEPDAFEYHYCDMGAGFVVIAKYSVDGDVIKPSYAQIYTSDGYYSVSASSTNGEFTDERADIVFGYIESDTARIHAKTEEITAANDALAASYGIEHSATNDTCVVELDLGLLTELVGA